MGSGRVSYDLLAHFDPPAADEHCLPRPSTRGVQWVLTWAAACAVLFVASCVLIQFSYCVAAEQALARAARAGVLEATLPRATQQSVAETIERRLADVSIPTGSVQITMLQNDAPLRGVFRAAGDDRLSVILSVPADAVLPVWLRAATFWKNDTQIQARAERRIPGRRLQMAARD
ncbi:MAG: hypothetical protein L0228_07890 [Planctomycetes bacterium]|nr:hypothetical protein [Planctomycetota bacterium]